jgi:hypothetical protein
LDALVSDGHQVLVSLSSGQEGIFSRRFIDNADISAFALTGPQTLCALPRE